MLTFATTVDLRPKHRQDISLLNRGVSTKRNDVNNLPCTVGSYFSIIDGCKRELVENDNSLVSCSHLILYTETKKSHRYL